MTELNSVPARIVIMGTSKMPLSKRFTELGAPRIVRQIDDGNYMNGALHVATDSIDRRPRNNVSKPSAFLHDDYMDNKLYGPPLRNDQQRSRVPRFNIFNRDFNAERPFFNTESVQYVDPTMMSLDEYSFRTFRPRRPRFSKFSIQNRYKFSRNPIKSRRNNFYFTDYDYPYADINRLSFRAWDMASSRAPIQNRLSMVRPKWPGFQRRPAVTQFKTRSRPRTPFRRVRPRFFRMLNNSDPRPKLTLEDLNKELDEYMKASKHPRVESFA